MSLNQLSKVRRLAAAIVLANLLIIGALAVALPSNAHAALPLLALVLPWISAAAIERALSHQPRAQRRNRPARAAGPQLGRLLHHAA